jgi:hypothetical protein
LQVAPGLVPPGLSLPTGLTAPPGLVQCPEFMSWRAPPPGLTLPDAPPGLLEPTTVPMQEHAPGSETGSLAALLEKHQSEDQLEATRLSRRWGR